MSVLTPFFFYSSMYNIDRPPYVIPIDKPPYIFPFETTQSPSVLIIVQSSTSVPFFVTTQPSSVPFVSKEVVTVLASHDNAVALLPSEEDQTYSAVIYVGVMLAILMLVFIWWCQKR